MSRLMLLLGLGAFALLAAAENLWIEHYDETSDKKFYYHSVTRESKWEVPRGAQVQYMDGTTGQAMGSESSAPEAESGFGGVTALGITMLPIAIVFGGLFILRWQAEQNGLSDVLKTMRQKRDRSAKRKGSKAGSNFRQKYKLSQDGKGGRSANS